MTTDLEQMTKFYRAIENLPLKNPGEFSLLSGTSSPLTNYFYITVRDKKYTNCKEEDKEYRGMRGRFYLWDNIILKMLGDMGYNFKNHSITNRFYSSRLLIKDKETKSELRIWSPKGDSFKSLMFKNRFKGRLIKK